MRITSVTAGSPTSRPAAASRRSPSAPIPWKEWGPVRGLKAPPRSIVAPAALTARAAASICSSLSTAHGPAMTTGSAPQRDPGPPDGHLGVFGMEVAPDQLVGLGDVDDLAHAGEAAERRLVDVAGVAENADGGPVGPGNGGGPKAGRADPGDDLVDVPGRGVMVHHDEHVVSSSPATEKTRAPGVPAPEAQKHESHGAGPLKGPSVALWLLVCCYSPMRARKGPLRQHQNRAVFPNGMSSIFFMIF